MIRSSIAYFTFLGGGGINAPINGANGSKSFTN